MWVNGPRISQQMAVRRQLPTFGLDIVKSNQSGNSCASTAKCHRSTAIVSPTALRNNNNNNNICHQPSLRLGLSTTLPQHCTLGTQRTHSHTTRLVGICVAPEPAYNPLNSPTLSLVGTIIRERQSGAEGTPSATMCW